MLLHFFLNASTCVRWQIHKECVAHAYTVCVYVYMCAQCNLRILQIVQWSLSIPQIGSNLQTVFHNLEIACTIDMLCNLIFTDCVNPKPLPPFLWHSYHALSIMFLSTKILEPLLIFPFPLPAANYESADLYC